MSLKPLSASHPTPHCSPLFNYWLIPSSDLPWAGNTNWGLSFLFTRTGWLEVRCPHCSGHLKRRDSTFSASGGDLPIEDADYLLKAEGGSIEELRCVDCWSSLPPELSKAGRGSSVLLMLENWANFFLPPLEAQLAAAELMDGYWSWLDHIAASSTPKSFSN